MIFYSLSNAAYRVSLGDPGAELDGARSAFANTAGPARLARSTDTARVNLCTYIILSYSNCTASIRQTKLQAVFTVSCNTDCGHITILPYYATLIIYRNHSSDFAILSLSNMATIFETLVFLLNNVNNGKSPQQLFLTLDTMIHKSAEISTI